MTKKRGKTPSLLTGSSGNPNRISAKRKRNCKRCSEVISMGEVCYEVPVPGGLRSSKTYCKICFLEILEQTQKDLDNLKKISE
jgi:hypothetical protein